MTFEDFLNRPPFSMDKAEKEQALTGRLTELTKLHRANCPEYARMLDAVGFDPENVRPGVWNVMPVQKSSHVGLKGGILQYRDVLPFYLGMLEMLDRLPQ